LIEIVAIGALRAAGFSVRSIRQIVTNCEEIFQLPHPLASLKFKVGGGDVFVQAGNELVEVGRRKRMIAWNEFLSPFLNNLDYEFDIARRWWPRGHEAYVVVDPEYGFGLPVIVGSGVRTEIVRERFTAGDSREQIADDFNLSALEVDHALRFETATLAA
ncbi:MAG: DUF433 domain-containing protein, partial [Chloroflexota bacterium]